MFVRLLTVAVKPGQRAGLARVIEEVHIPVLKRFSGYRDQMSMICPDGTQAILMSFWDSGPQAEAYVRDGYPEVLAATAPFINGTPVLSTYDMMFSTAYHMHAVGA